MRVEEGRKEINNMTVSVIDTIIVDYLRKGPVACNGVCSLWREREREREREKKKN